MKIAACRNIEVFMVVLLCSGCVGIAHRSVQVPPLDIDVHASQAYEIEILCPEFYAGSSTLIEVIGGSLNKKSHRYDWRQVGTHSSNAVSTTCRKEDRYLGSLVVLFFVIGPNDKESRSRSLYVRVSDANKLYRIDHLADGAKVEELDLLGLHEQFPPMLNLPEPSATSTRSSEYYSVRMQYYNSLKWRPSNRISLSNVQSDGDGAVLSVQMTIKEDK